MPEKIRKGRYRHFKGKYYRVTGIALHSETLERHVVYQALYDHPRYGRNSLWIRPERMFRQIVKRDGRTMKRFTWAGNSGKKRRKSASER